MTTLLIILLSISLISNVVFFGAAKCMYDANNDLSLLIDRTIKLKLKEYSNGNV